MEQENVFHPLDWHRLPRLVTPSVVKALEHKIYTRLVKVHVGTLKGPDSTSSSFSGASTYLAYKNTCTCAQRCKYKAIHCRIVVARK